MKLKIPSPLRWTLAAAVAGLLLLGWALLGPKPDRPPPGNRTAGDTSPPPVAAAPAAPAAGATSAPAEAPPDPPEAGAPPAGEPGFAETLASQVGVRLLPPYADTGGDLEAQEPFFEAIMEASATYSPEGLEVLEPLLGHPDPEIRESAIEGIVQLGEPEGIAVLRRAAESTTFPENRGALLEAAEFLELPGVDGGALPR